MADVTTAVNSAGAAATIGSFIANVLLATLVAWQAKKSSVLADQKSKAEAKASESSSGDMIRAQESLLAASKATAEAWEKSAVEWKTQHEKLSAIHETSRKDWHDRNDASNLIQLRLSEENAVLKSQTNLSPIMDSLERIVDSQKQMSEVLLQLCRRLDIRCDEEQERAREKAA